MKIALNRMTKLFGVRFLYKLHRKAMVCAAIASNSLFSASANASEWIEIAVQNNGSVYLLDIDSVQKYHANSKLLKFWTKEDARNNSEKKYLAKQTLMVMDCENRKFGFVVFYEKNANGEIINGFDFSDVDSEPEMLEIISGTIIESYEKIICNYS